MIVERLRREHSVHPQHLPGWSARFTHYVLAFHDETFECIAQRHTVSAGASTFAEALESCAKKVLR